MHILLIYKVVTKQLEINQSKRAQTTPKPRKSIQKLKKFHKIFDKNMCKKAM